MLRSLRCVFVGVLMSSPLLAIASPANVSVSSRQPQVTVMACGNYRHHSIARCRQSGGSDSPAPRVLVRPAIFAL